MNDNRTNRPRPPRLVAILGGIAPKPEACFCGSQNAFADRDPDTDERFVSCADCGAEGPRVATYDLAVAQWNALTGSDPQE